MAQKIATKRSGQRGHTARQDLLAAEAALATLQAQDPQTYVTASMAHELMSQIFGAYEALDVEADEARAKSILRGLGFKDEELLMEGKEIGALSGGWRMRVMLGKALFIKPDILLLDEPSSFSSYYFRFSATYTCFSEPFGPSCDRLASILSSGRDGGSNSCCCFA
jgi:ATPase subunit of ABC transporter with duplicated ATPase domains